jgi:hypothetical protein
MSPDRRSARWIAGVAVLTTIGIIVLPGHRAAVLGAGVMLILGLLLIEIGGAANRLAPGRDALWERVRRVASPKGARPADLERIERGLGWGRYSTGDFNYRVRPLLRRLTVQRLRESHGVDAEKRPEDARAVVTAELWNLVIDKQPAEAERVIGTADIARMVDEIEAI